MLILPIYNTYFEAMSDQGEHKNQKDVAGSMNDTKGEDIILGGKKKDNNESGI